MTRIGRPALVLAAALAALLACVPAAPADHHDMNLPWPGLLPPAPGPEPGPGPQPGPVPRCPRAEIACVDDLLRRLERQWRPLDRRCDHRALFSLSYLRITAGLREDLARERPRWFRHREWMIPLITTFSNRYFAAFEDYRRGRPVPAPWRITFDEAARGDANGGQDVLLASNAHTNHDLPFAIAELGTRAPDGASRKPDHDGVNEVNTRVFDELEDEFARRYDPSFELIDLKPSPLDELGTMEAVKSWRENAWRQGERLVAARTAEERRLVEDQIRETSTLWAELIRSVKAPGTRAVRDAHCRAYHARRH